MLLRRMVGGRGVGVGVGGVTRQHIKMIHLVLSSLRILTISTLITLHLQNEYT